MAHYTSITDAWLEFENLHGSEHPVRGRAELLKKIHDSGLYFDNRSTSKDWSQFFEDLFESGWIYGDQP